MDWILIAILVCISYGIIAWYIQKMKILPEVITFHGPFMMLKTQRISFFDKFKPYSTFFRIYGTIGIGMVVVISVAITTLILISLPQHITHPPAPEGINSPINWFVIPGVNQFIPLTLPVILALIITIAIHEFGHGILCRIEGIKIKGMGVILFIIPVGFFVEPDEEELEKTAPIPKSRMFGAGITNNLVLGFTCFITMILLLSMLVPISGPIIYMLQKDYPAYNASVPLGSVVQEINGEKVGTMDDILKILNRTQPGDSINLTVLSVGVVKDLSPTDARPEGTTYTFNLTSSPERSSGFMGISYYDSEGTLKVIKNLISPGGFLILTILPIDILPDYNLIPELHPIFMESPDFAFFKVPFPFFWEFIHLLFWCGWFNLMVGIFNAIPMMPLDGGYILKEGVKSLTKKLEKPELADRIALTISLFLLFVIILVVTIPLIASVAPKILDLIKAFWLGI